MSEKVPINKKIRIIVPREKGGGDGFFVPGETGKGVIRTRRRDEFLPRRRKKQTVGWRFFDLGQVPFEDYFSDVMFFGDAGITPDYAANVVEVNEDVPAPDLEAKNDYYTDLPPEQLATDFFQLKEVSADVFRISIQTPSIGQTVLTSDNSRWNNGKIIIEESESLNWVIFRGNPLFSSIFLYMTDALRPFGCKVTATPDFADAELTTFQLERTADIYFTPSFSSPGFEAKGRRPNDRGDVFYYEDEFGAHTPIETPYNFIQTLHTNFLTFPRNELVHLMPLWSTVAYAAIDTAPFDASVYELFYEVQNYLEGLSGTRNMRLLQGYRTLWGPPQTTTLHNILEDSSVSAPTWDFPNPDYFPAPPASPVVTNVDDRATEYDAVWFSFAQSGELRCIIKQNNQFYYVWER